MSSEKRTRSPRLLEASRFFMREGDVYDTLRRLARRLDEERMDYVVVGGMALVEHGYRRTTEDIDIVMRPETLEAFRERCVGRGYLPAFAGAKKAFRDTESGVRIEVLTTGGYPGDGKPKPIAFPDPGERAVVGEEFRYVPLETLIELKLASGLTAPHRIQDLADVQSLIHHAKLARDLAERLDPSVRDEYVRLWEIVQTIPPPE